MIVKTNNKQIGFLYQTMPTMKPFEWTLHDQVNKCNLTSTFKSIERYLIDNYTSFILENIND